MLKRMLRCTHDSEKEKKSWLGVSSSPKKKSKRLTCHLPGAFKDTPGIWEVQRGRVDIPFKSISAMCLCAPSHAGRCRRKERGLEGSLCCQHDRLPRVPLTLIQLQHLTRRPSEHPYAAKQLLCYSITHAGAVAPHKGLFSTPDDLQTQWLDFNSNVILGIFF